MQTKTKSKKVIKLAATPRNTDWQKVRKTGGDADCKSDDETLCATERRESSGTSTVVNKLIKKKCKVTGMSSLNNSPNNNINPIKLPS